MFNKLKLKIKTKLRNWLEVDTLETKLLQTNDELKTFDKITNFRFKNQSDLIDDNMQAIDVIHRTIESVIHIGTDVRETKYRDSGSWAVICIEGNVNVVKFVDLRGQDIRDIVHYLKRYEAGRHCIDTPYSSVFYDQLWNFDNNRKEN